MFKIDLSNLANQLGFLEIFGSYSFGNLQLLLTIGGDRLLNQITVVCFAAT